MSTGEESWLAPRAGDPVGSVRLSPTTVIECSLDGCPWTYELQRLDPGQLRAPTRPTTGFHDHLNAAIAASVAWASARDEAKIIAHMATHPLRDFLETIARLKQELGGPEREEWAIEMSGGSMQVRCDEATREYPLERWLPNQHKMGHRVHRRRVVVLEPWKRVPRADAPDGG